MMMVLNYGVAGKHKEIELYGENYLNIQINVCHFIFVISFNIMDDCVCMRHHISCTIGGTFHASEIVNKIKSNVGQVRMMM